MEVFGAFFRKGTASPLPQAIADMRRFLGRLNSGDITK